MFGYWLGCYHWLIILEEEEMVVVEGQEQNHRTDISVSGLELLNTTAVTMITKANGQISEHSEQRGAGVGNCRYQVNCNIRRQIEMFWCLSQRVSAACSGPHSNLGTGPWRCNGLCLRHQPCAVSSPSHSH